MYIPNVKKHTSSHPLNTLYAFLYTHHYMGVGTGSRTRARSRTEPPFR